MNFRKMFVCANAMRKSEKWENEIFRALLVLSSTKKWDSCWENLSPSKDNIVRFSYGTNNTNVCVISPLKMMTIVAFIISAMRCCWGEGKTRKTFHLIFDEIVKENLSWKDYFFFFFFSFFYISQFGNLKWFSWFHIFLPQFLT